MFLKRTKENKNMSKKERLIKLVASFIFLIGAFMYIGRMGYNYYIELRDYKKAQEFLNIGKEETEVIKVDIDEEDTQEQPKQEEEQTPTYDYIGVLEIPKINIKRGILNIKDNKVYQTTIYCDCKTYYNQYYFIRKYIKFHFPIIYVF